MAWSTRELAKLAGTSLRAVRHYHDVGLLPLPERRANGYKSYGVEHLVRLLRIKRYVDLGFSLSRIAEMDADEDLSGDTATEALRALDAELAATIERLQATRGEIARMLREETSADLPPGFSTAMVRTELSDADNSVILVLSRLLGPRQWDNFQDWIASAEPTDADREFIELPADADERTRADLAARMLPQSQRIRDKYGGSPITGPDLGKALAEIYNRAQLDVLVRVSQLLPPADADG
ncbi:MerR family transcriptional regulator [Fodinicola acaciae]|uniref:MerR family transcriptional regulator n=1 Tax=Fodinicola acaciae TaxID=2681555 RepID=UPI0013D242FA|nr:MerR family transcriptional regulator [Fodinicola acaciae]